MQLFTIAALLFVARVAAEQPQEVSNAQPVPVPVGQPQVGQVVPVAEHQQGPQQVVHHYGPSVASQHHHHHQSAYPVEHQYAAQAGAVAQYSPAGLVQVVSGGGDNKPQYVSAVQQQQQQQGVRHYAASAVPVASGEQYGQPEPAGIPPNYKPFGSWGLYIGGNPADGYYSNYYKALSNSVDKQQVGPAGEQSVKPSVASAAGVNQASAFNPMLRQASYQPYNSYQDQVYPFDYYTPADLNSGSRIVSVDSAAPSSAVMPSTYSAAGVPTSSRMSPVQMGAQVYGSPVAFANSEPAPSPYADSYGASSKRAATPSQQTKQDSQMQPPSSKGYAQKRYGYAYSPAPVQQQQQQPQQQPQQPQVFAYPVPVGSQIVGSQPGVEGAFQPYGVHGYTRYAIKPTVVASEQQAYYGVQSSPQFPVYKQQQQYQQYQHQYPVVYQQQPQQPQQAPAAYQPLGFYGYPLSQLHYSQGSIVPAFQSSSSSSVVEHQQNGVAVGASPVGPVGQVEAASSEKSESEVDKPHTVHKQQQQQKRA